MFSKLSKNVHVTEFNQHRSFQQSTYFEQYLNRQKPFYISKIEIVLAQVLAVYQGHDVKG